MRPVPNPIAAVLFDLDGTLVDSAPDLALAAERMRAARGLPPLPLDRYRPHASAGARGMLDIAFGITPEAPVYEAMKQEFLASYAQGLLDTTHCFDGVDLLLAALHRHSLPWGIVTNKVDRFTTPLVAGFPQLAAAGTVISGDTTPHAKPHPEPLLEAARRLAVAPAACLYIGDDERDIVAGREAGMYTVAARYGYLGVEGRVDHWGADAHIDSPADLLKLLELP